MKYLTFFLLLSFFPITALFSQQIKLEGRVSMHNSQYRTGEIVYVQNAYVQADFAAPDDTDSEGRFALVFSEVPKGTDVEVAVEKAGLEVVNAYDLRGVVVGRKSPLRVFLANKGYLAQAQTELYDISIAALTREHDRLIAQLREGGQTSQATLDSLEQQLNREITNRFEAEDILNEKLEAYKKQLPASLERLARVNLDYATASYRRAFEFYREGKVEKAIQSLEEAELEQSTDEVIASIQQLDKSITDYELALEKEQQRVARIVDSYQLKAEAYNLLFEYRKALEVYKKAVGLLERTKEKADVELADAYDAIGSIYRDLGEYAEALTCQEKKQGDQRAAFRKKRSGSRYGLQQLSHCLS